MTNIQYDEKNAKINNEFNESESTAFLQGLSSAMKKFVNEYGSPEQVAKLLCHDSIKAEQQAGG